MTDDALYGLSAEEATRRYLESHCTPGDIVEYEGQVECWLILEPLSRIPEDMQFMRACSYCGSDAGEVLYLFIPIMNPTCFRLCHACMAWAGLLRPAVMTGAALV